MVLPILIVLCFALYEGKTQHIGLSLADDIPFFVCHFSPSGAKNDTQSTERTMLPQAKVL